jgi:hypothetical protein
MSKKSDAQSGRVAYDERGQPVWEWRVDTGVFSRDVDTRQMRKIQEEAAVKLQDAPPPSRRSMGFDPYSTAVAKEPPPPKEVPSKPQPPKTRRTLDDMRQLSEEIKKNRLRK